MDEVIPEGAPGGTWHDRGAPLPSGDTGGKDHLTPTIYDVARAAGVSIASVSRVLNGRRNPLPDTRERVERAPRRRSWACRVLCSRFRRAADLPGRAGCLPARLRG